MGSSKRKDKSQPILKKKLLSYSTHWKRVTLPKSNTSELSSLTVCKLLIMLRQMILWPNTFSSKSHTDQVPLSRKLVALFKIISRNTSTSQSSLLLTEQSFHHQQNTTQVR